MQILFHAKLPVVVKKKKDWYVSFCPVLDVFSQGETKKKAIENIKEALRLFLISCYKRGSLDQVLKDCGFEPIRKKSVKIKPFAKKFESVDVPLPFQIKHKSEAVRCHA